MGKNHVYLGRFKRKNLVYYVTTVTYKRERIFLNPFAAKFLITNVAYHKFILDYKLYAYVVMPDHFHLIIQPVGEWDISKIMNYIKGTFSRKYNKVYNRKGHLWQKGFFERVCRSKRNIISAINYVHMNPVRIGLVNSPEEYPYSSFWQIYGHQRSSDFIDKILL